MNNKKHLVTFLLILSLSLLMFVSPAGSLSQTAQASSTYSAYVTSYTLAIRNSTGSRYRIIHTLSMSNRVTVISIQRSFARIRYGKVEGYVFKNYLSRNPFKSHSAYVTSYLLTIRNQASSHFSARYTLSMGNKVLVTGEGTLYAQVNYLGKKGYVQKKYLSRTPFKNYTAYINCPGMNVRDRAASSFHALYLLKRGTAVTVTGRGSVYAQISYKKIKGYVQAKYLTTKKPAASSIVKSYISTSYPYSFSNALNLQIQASSQTDKKYNKYMSKKSLKISGSTGTVQGASNTSWNVRGGPGTNYWVVTNIKRGTRVNVLHYSNPAWYQVDFSTGWVNASPSDIAYYLNPADFPVGTTSYYQFLTLSNPTSVSPDELNSKILAGRGTLAGQGAAFIQAAELQHINEVYLIAHAMLESGNGTSELASGYRVTKVHGKNVVPRVVYNMYGIGAYDQNPIVGGSEYAYQQKWFSPAAAIIGGAKFIAADYINNSTYHQDTLYKMRWNPAHPATHQYATDIGWAVKQTITIRGLYDLLSTKSLTFDVPKYRN
jgi:Beta- N-acetylglucosaminidase